MLKDIQKAVINKELQVQFCEFLVKKTGLYYPKNRWSDLEKKLVLIKNSFGFDDIAPCLEWLMNHPINKEKLDVLTSHLTIGETYFFRDQQLFNALEQYIIPDILRRHHSNLRMRIFSAGCCTGEEPYSIGMLLHRIIPNIKEWDISILGCDINPQFLFKAERAKYKKWSFRNTPSAIQERYFKKNSDETYTIIPEIRKMVNFMHLNLVDDTYPDVVKGINEMDLICCHNVLIYFSENQIKKTIHQLTKTITNNGWLSVSAIEVPFIEETALNPYRYPGVIFFKKETTKTKNPPKENQAAKTEPVLNINTKKAPPLPSKSLNPNVTAYEPTADPDRFNLGDLALPDHNDHAVIFEKCNHLYSQKAYPQAIALLLPLLAPFQNDSTALSKFLKEVILLIRIYANQGDLILALEWSKKALLADKLHPMLHYLNAMLLQAQGNTLDSIKSLKRALFNDPNFIMAHFMLGILEKEQGNKMNAIHEFKTALKLITHHLPEDPIPGAEEFNSDYLQDMITSHLNNL